MLSAAPVRRRALPVFLYETAWQKLPIHVGAAPLTKQTQPVLSHRQMRHLPRHMGRASLGHGQPQGVVKILNKTLRVRASKGNLLDRKFKGRVHINALSDELLLENQSYFTQS